MSSLSPSPSKVMTSWAKPLVWCQRRSWGHTTYLCSGRVLKMDRMTNPDTFLLYLQYFTVYRFAVFSCTLTLFVKVARNRKPTSFHEELERCKQTTFSVNHYIQITVISPLKWILKAFHLLHSYHFVPNPKCVELLDSVRACETVRERKKTFQ